MALLLARSSRPCWERYPAPLVRAESWSLDRGKRAGTGSRRSAAFAYSLDRVARISARASRASTPTIEGGSIHFERIATASFAIVGRIPGSQNLRESQSGPSGLGWRRSAEQDRPIRLFGLDPILGFFFEGPTLEIASRGEGVPFGQLDRRHEPDVELLALEIASGGDQGIGPITGEPQGFNPVKAGGGEILGVGISVEKLRERLGRGGVIRLGAGPSGLLISDQTQEVVG